MAAYMNGHTRNLNSVTFCVFFQYCSEIGSVDSAPYRTVTVRDALADLPEIKINPTYDVSEYLLKTTSPFQRQVRLIIK